MFVTSLYEIDCLIKEKQQPLLDKDLIDKQLFKLKLLALYYNL